MKSKARWFIVAIVIQLALLTVIPVPRLLLLASGKTVMLETVPYDPYNVFHGYYANLRYEISRVETFDNRQSFEQNHFYYVIIEKGSGGIWRGKGISRKLPVGLGRDQAALKGRYRYGWLEYGIEQYYLPEGRRKEIDNLLNVGKKRALVEVKVNEKGEAALVRIIAGGRSFEY